MPSSWWTRDTRPVTEGSFATQWKNIQTVQVLHLLSSAGTQALVTQGGAVEFVHEPLDLRQLVVDQLQADGCVHLLIILAVQYRNVLGQLRQPSLQAQHQALQLPRLCTADDG